MRTITVKYPGECRKCGAGVGAGDLAGYERRVGLFCPGCTPTDPEEIRAYRQEAADRKADRLEEWAEKREQRAHAQLTSLPELRRDHAFNTQPGHIPARARMNRADDRACQSLEVAKSFRDRANRLRKVRVAGDKEAERERRRERTRQWIQVGQIVNTLIYGKRSVVRVNKRTATLVDLETGKRKLRVDLCWLTKGE